MKPASNTKPSRSSRRRPGLRIEVLEPRLLYSADVFGAIDPLSADDPTDRGNEDVTSVLDLSATLDADRPDPTPPPPANPEFTSPRELVFIDTATPDYQTLVDDLSRSGRALEIVLIEPDQNGIDLIGRTLARHQAITAVHLISHGQAGEITLGNTMLNPTQLATHADTIAGWREALSNNADWLIYGCNLTATDEGERFIDEFARLTGADVAASDDLTGNAAKGGDWDLEYATGTIESQIAVSQAAQLSWNQVLDISSGLVGHWTLDSDATDSSGNGNTGILAGDAAIDTSSSTNNVGPGKLTLDGSGDYVELSNHAASFDSLTQGTIAGWINTADTTNTQAILGVADKGDPLSYSALGISQGKLFFDVAEAGGYLIRLDATPVIADGNWHHVAVTVDVNGNSLYIDGVKLASSQLSYTNGDASSTEFFSQVKNIDAVEIGVTGENGGLVWDFKGLLDDIRVYDRALDSGEIAQLYNFQKAPTDITLSQATAVSIANPGFEAQTLAEDQWTGSVTGWDINGTAGVGNPDFSAYSYGVPEGNNLAYLDEDPQHQLSQTLSETFQPGRSYALSAMIGDEIDGGYNPAGWEMRLFAGNQLLGAVNNNDFDPAEGTFEKATLHLSADDLAQYQAYYGQALKIEFYNSGITPGEDVHIDDVQLEYTAISVPENAANGTAVADIASVSDPNTGDTFTYSLADDAGGRFAINSLGEITVADGTLLDYESATSHDITVRATDASGLFYDEIVTIQVADVNDPPVNTLPAAQSANEDTPLSISGVSVTDADDNLSSVRLSVSNGVLNVTLAGAASISAGGNDSADLTLSGLLADINNTLASLIYRSHADFNGSDTLTMVSTDSDGASDSDTMAISVNPVNDGPVINDPNHVFINEIHYDNTGTDSGEAIELAGPNGTDISGWSLVLYNGANGLAYDTKTLSGTFTDQGEGFGTLVFNYATNGIQNGDSAADGIALVDNNGKVVEFLSYEGQFTAINGPAAGLVSSDIGVSESSATPVGDSLQRTGAGPVFTWDNAKPATFGTVNSSQSFSTLAAPLGLQTVTEDTALTFSPATGNIIAIADIDADDSPGDPLQVTVSTSSGSLSLGTTSGLSGVAGNGTNNVSFFGRVEEVNAALNGLAYTPAPNYSGSDTLTIEVNDQGNTGGSILSDTMTVNLTVVPVNDAPTLAGIEGSPLTHTENDPASIVSSAITVTDVDDTNIESATIQIAGNYQSGEDLLSFTDTTNITGHWDAATGTLSLSGSDTLANYQAALRTVAYVNTSDNPSTLTRSATFTVNDGTAGSNVQTRDITLSPVNDEQSLDTNAGMTVDEEATATITSTMLSTSDVEQSPAQIIYTVASVPANGALKLDGSPLSASNTFTQDDIDNGRLVYAHNGSETTADSFTFTVDDGFGTATSGTFNITVNPVNDAPVATVDSFSVAEGSTTTLDIANNDYDPDDGLNLASIVIDTLPSHGTLSFNNDGTVGYVHDGSETTSDNFVYRISDNSGAQSHSVLVSLTVTPVNDAPAFDSLPIVAATENSLYTYDIVTNDPDAGTTLTLTSTNLPAWLTLTDHGDGTATLSGTPGNSDVGSHNISLEVSDGSLTAAQTFTLTVSNTNSPPLGLPSITGTPTEDQTLTVDVSAISDGDGLGPFNYQWLRNGAVISGAASASHILGDADVGAQISVRVSYTDGDGNLETLISDPTAAIANINDAPTGSVLIDNPHPAPGDTLAISHTLADDDGFPGAVNYQWQRDGADIPGATGSTYTVTPGDIGKPVTVTLTYTDGHGTLEAVTAAPVIPVNSGGGTSSGGGSANIPPEITSGGGENTAAVAIPENQTSVTTVVAVDPDGDKPTLTISGGADHGLFQIDVTTGQLSFTAPPDYENPSDENHDGVYQVAITALDPDGGSDTQTLLISVKNINEKPAITSLPMDEISEADVYQYQVRASDPDDSQHLAWTATGLPPWLNLEDQGDGSAILRGQPEAGGEYLISLQVSDGELSTIQTFLLKVTPAGPVTPDPGEVAKPEPDEPAPSTPLDEPGNTGGPIPIIPPEEVTPPVSPPHPGNPSDITDMTDETPPPPTLALIATIDPSTSQEAWNFARKLSPGSESTHFPPPAVEANPTAHELSLPLAGNINPLPKEDGVPLPGPPGTGPVAALESKLEEPATNQSGDKSIQAGDTAPVSPVLQPGTNTRFPEPLPLNHHLFANLADIERFSSKSPVTPNPTADHPPMDNRHPQGSPFGVPKTTVNPIAFVDIPENSAFMNDLDQTRQDLDRDAEKQAEASKLSVQTATGISLAFSAGVVHWALRPNSLLAGFLSALPFWKQVDPLPILGASDPNGSEPEPPEPASQKHDGPVETLFDNEPTSPPDSHREQP